MTDVHHVQLQVRLHDFLQRRLERLDQPVRQFANESDRVGEQDVLIGRQTQSPRRGIECGEEFVLSQDLGAGERVEQSGFARVGVADDGGQRPQVALPPGALGATLAAHQHQFLANPVNALLHASSVGFEL